MLVFYDPQVLGQLAVRHLKQLCVSTRSSVLIFGSDLFFFPLYLPLSSPSLSLLSSQSSPLLPPSSDKKKPKKKHQKKKKISPVVPFTVFFFSFDFFFVSIFFPFKSPFKIRSKSYVVKIHLHILYLKVEFYSSVFVC